MSVTSEKILLARADRLLAKLEDSLSLVAAMFILVLMVLGTMNAIGRKLGYPVWGYNDIVTLCMVAFSFLAISAMQRIGGHIRMELVIRSFKGRLLWATEFIGVLLAIFIITVLVYYSSEAFMRAFELGDSTIDRELITWPSKIWVPIALSVLLARLILQAIGYTRLIIWPDAQPVAVPLMHDVAAIADKEIQDAFGDKADAGASGRGEVS